MSDTAGRGTAVRGAAVRVLVVALFLGGGLAVAAWSTPTYDSAGDRCASALHFHPGSGYRVHGGEMSGAERAAVSDQCDQSGALGWLLGWLALGAGVATVAGCAAVLLVTRPRRHAA